VSEVTPKNSSTRTPQLNETGKLSGAWKKSAKTSGILEHDLKGNYYHESTIVTEGVLGLRNLYEECTCKHGVPTDS
jgi:hypothetical protein